MTSLTVAFVSSRREPHLDWLMDSLQLQCFPGQIAHLIFVDGYSKTEKHVNYRFFFDPTDTHPCISKVTYVEPKPTIWQGKHRITKEDWWAKSNALNTAICLCDTEWIAFCDDRSVLMPTWMQAVTEAMGSVYAVCGSYEKRHNIEVEKGRITNPGTLDGVDPRKPNRGAVRSYTWYGGSYALPLEYCLKVNGFAEDTCDSLGMEDVVFGDCLVNSGLQTRYDWRMRIVEDRTPGKIDGNLKRSDFGISPRDKSHGILKRMDGQKTSLNSYDIRAVRETILAGGYFPPPSASHNDWWDGQSIPEKFDKL